MSTQREQGFTLTELLIVISLLAVVAAIAIPDFSSDEKTSLDIATADVVGAIRFAHSESIRTGLSYGIVADKQNQRIRVYRIDTSVDPAALRFDNYDPLTKQPYELVFSSGESDVILAETDFKFVGVAASSDYLGFAAGTGVPAAGDAGKLRMLESAFIRLKYENNSTIIGISPITARVTVQ